jgi:hypothetical protein
MEILNKKKKATNFALMSNVLILSGKCHFLSFYRYSSERVSYVNAVNEATGSGNQYLSDKIMTLYNVHIVT